MMNPGIVLHDTLDGACYCTTLVLYRVLVETFSIVSTVHESLIIQTVF